MRPESEKEMILVDPAGFSKGMCCAGMGTGRHAPNFHVICDSGRNGCHERYSDLPDTDWWEACDGLA